MVKRCFAECCISFSRHKISFAEAVIMCRIRNVEELKIKNKNWRIVVDIVALEMQQTNQMMLLVLTLLTD